MWTGGFCRGVNINYSPSQQLGILISSCCGCSLLAQCSILCGVLWRIYEIEAPKLLDLTFKTLTGGRTCEKSLNTRVAFDTIPLLFLMMYIEDLIKSNVLVFASASSSRLTDVNTSTLMQCQCTGYISQTLAEAFRFSNKLFDGRQSKRSRASWPTFSLLDSIERRESSQPRVTQLQLEWRQNNAKRYSAWCYSFMAKHTVNTYINQTLNKNCRRGAELY